LEEYQRQEKIRLLEERIMLGDGVHTQSEDQPTGND
jgi:hypothetical protein